MTARPAVVTRARPWWQRVLGGLSLAALVTAAGLVFGAGRTSESVTRDLEDHGRRLDSLEPRVDSLERTIPLPIQLQLDSIQRDAAETKKDVREMRQEIRDALRGR